MAYEPCMTLKELAKLKGLSLTAITNRAKKLPYPEPVTFAKKVSVAQANVHRRSVQYRRSALLKWFEEASSL